LWAAEGGWQGIKKPTKRVKEIREKVRRIVRSSFLKIIFEGFEGFCVGIVPKNGIFG